MAPADIILIVALVGVLGLAFYYFRQRDAGPASASRRVTPSHRAPAPPPSSSGQKRRFNWLTIEDNDGAIFKAFHIGSRTVTIGRGVGNVVQVADDEDISRRHTQLMPSARGLQVKDMESGNGTFVNEERVNDMRILEDGDVLRVGRTSFVFHRIGDFARNDALSGRNASQDAMRETRASSQTLGDMVREVLAEANGDVERAAEIAELSPDAIRQMCAAEGINPESFRR